MVPLLPPYFSELAFKPSLQLLLYRPRPCALDSPCPFPALPCKLERGVRGAGCGVYFSLARRDIDGNRPRDRIGQALLRRGCPAPFPAPPPRLALPFPCPALRVRARGAGVFFYSPAGFRRLSSQRSHSPGPIAAGVSCPPPLLPLPQT